MTNPRDPSTDSAENPDIDTEVIADLDPADADSGAVHGGVPGFTREVTRR
jgi:hypothetical protein